MTTSPPMTQLPTNLVLSPGKDVEPSSLNQSIIPEQSFAQGCYCGLEMSQTIPYEVLAIDDLIDTNFTPQGMPGYLNRDVKIGDRILSIDGHAVGEHVSLDEIHSMLRGRLHTTIEIRLASRSDPSDQFTIAVLRHRFHEFDGMRPEEKAFKAQRC